MMGSNSGSLLTGDLMDWDRTQRGPDAAPFPWSMGDDADLEESEALGRAIGQDTVANVGAAVRRALLAESNQD